MPKQKRSPAAPPGPPFGIPDASSAGLEQMTRDFVDFAQSSISGDLAVRANDRFVRIVVGKKGVGKTLYLRRFHDSARQDRSVYVSPRDASPPGTEEVVALGQCFSSALVTEGWVLVWKRAIHRAIASHLLHDREFRTLLDDDDRETLASDYARLLPQTHFPTSIYSEVRDIASEYSTTSQRLERYLRDPTWGGFEYQLHQILRTLPPMYFFLDAIDDNFHRAPMYWLECQKGLFHQAVELYQRAYSGRLHVLVCIRDTVYSSVLRSEHASRYRGDPHIRILDWDARAIRYFFREKLARLSPDHKISGDREGVVGWLGSAQLAPDADHDAEDLEEYVLRHTRLIPRDVVIVGNLLCDAVAEAKRNRLGAVPGEQIRRIVSSAARGFADEQLRICASQIAGDQIPEHAARYGLTDVFTGSQMYSEGVFDQLARVLRTFGSERTDADGLALLREAAAEEFAGHQYVPDVLWQNGLLGYETEDDGDRPYAHFYAGTAVDEFGVPPDRGTYVLHPCLAHRLQIAPARPRISGYAPA